MTPPRLVQLLHPLAAIVAFAACKDTPATAPEDPIPPSGPELGGMAIRLTVDVVQGKVTVHTPASEPSQAATSAGTLPTSIRPNFALLGETEVGVTAPEESFSRSEVGEFLPGKIRVSFDVAITNRLTGAAFVTPTFPPPEFGQQALLLFPFAVSSDVGEVAASPDWDLGPHNFFNDVGCGTDARSDCYRYQPFPQPLGPGATSELRRVGFDIDPEARVLDLDLVLAADVAVPGPAATTTAIIFDEPDPSVAGQEVTVTFSVLTLPGATPTGTQPTGDVTVTASSGESCSGPLSELTGAGICRLTLTTEGEQTLTATYAGKNNAFEGSSDTEVHTVLPPPPPPSTRPPGPDLVPTFFFQTVAGTDGITYGAANFGSEPADATSLAFSITVRDVDGNTVPGGVRRTQEVPALAVDSSATFFEPFPDRCLPLAPPEVFTCDVTIVVNPVSGERDTGNNVLDFPLSVPTTP